MRIKTAEILEPRDGDGENLLPEENSVPIEIRVDETTVLVAWVLRDSMQSLLVNFEDWVTDAQKLGDLLIGAQNTEGISVLEWGGGRAREVAALNGKNINKVQEEALAKLLDSMPDGGRMIERMALYRGPQVTGYTPVHPTVQKAIIKRDVETGTTVGRFFDGLNDIENLIFHDIKGFHAQFAMAFSRDARYTDAYYVNLAKEAKEQGAQSFCIKDTAGLIREDRIKTLVPKLKALGLDVVLHTHSTDHEGSKAAICAAVECGIDQIEVSVMPLAGGTAHHDILELLDDPVVGPKIRPKFDLQALRELQNEMEGIFEDKKQVNGAFSKKLIGILLEANVPGGAAPSVLSLIEENFKEFFVEGASVLALENLIRIYAEELKKVREEASFPPPITPFADICHRQAAFNTNNLRGSLNLTLENLDQPFENISTSQELPVEQRYNSVTKAFLDMCRGHYGFIRNYAETDADGAYKIEPPDPSFRKFVATKPVAYEVGEDSLPSGTVFEDYYESGRHSSQRTEELPDQNYFLGKADRFKARVVKNIQSYGINADRAKLFAGKFMKEFGTRVDRSIAYSQKPKGKPETFVEASVILGYLKAESDIILRKQDIRQLINDVLSGKYEFSDLLDLEKFPEDVIVNSLKGTLDLVTRLLLEKYENPPYHAQISFQGTDTDPLLFHQLGLTRIDDLKAKINTLRNVKDDGERTTENWIAKNKKRGIKLSSDSVEESQRIALERAIDYLELQGTKYETERLLNSIAKHSDGDEEKISALKELLVDVVKANLYRIALEKNNIPSTRPQWIIDQEVDLGEIEYDGEMYEYTVVSNSSKNMIGVDQGYVFISETVLEKFRPLVLKHEIRERIKKEGVCIEITKKEWAELPWGVGEEDRKFLHDYIVFRRRFYEDLLEHFSKSENPPKDSFIAEITASFDFWKEKEKNPGVVSRVVGAVSGVLSSAD